MKLWRFLFLLVFLAACAPAPATPAVSFSGPIVDAQSGAPVIADVYVDDVLRLSKTDRLELVIPLRRDRLTEIRVKASGYRDWAIGVKGGESKRLEGPVRMNRETNHAPASGGPGPTTPTP